MTMIIKKPKPSSSSSKDKLVVGIDSKTKQLLYYDVNSDMEMDTGKELLLDFSAFEVHSDKEDCHIDICSPVVLSLFADNFDYQNLRHHLVKGLLDDNVMGYKLFTQLRHHWQGCNSTVDVPVCARCSVQSNKKVMGFLKDRTLGPDTYVGFETSVGDFSNSVIGKGCCIGSNVKIENSYVWDNVTVQNGVVLQPGVVLSFKVVVGAKSPVIPAYSKLSLLPQPTNQDSDEEPELTSRFSDVTEVGVSGVGYYIWSDTPRPKPEVLPAAEIISDDETSDLDNDDVFVFDIEVEATILRAALESEALDDLKTEVTALRLSYNMTHLN
ncbi:hypothetical protein C5167_009792 [Papaver somniferum]|uniref:Uncharacterized protein n=1 Tax=Papaver somniferum TaxID=3469 RepID=A0A4Y7K2C0_PAPSO|nr:hypothetical protein C5167_009792 [Papaver somniferum]